jgi:cellulose biosynthesis protein BcsQ
LVPSHISLAGAEIEMVNMMSRENLLKKALSELKETFDSNDTLKCFKF